MWEKLAVVGHLGDVCETSAMRIGISVWGKKSEDRSIAVCCKIQTMGGVLKIGEFGGRPMWMIP